MDVLFYANSALLGVGLAMDAFSVSTANGLNEPNMKKNKVLLIAFVFAAFQIAMPLIGWVCVHTVVEKFTAFEKFIPWIALALLGFIGGKMLYEAIRGGEDENAPKKLGMCALVVQGIATSIDALSVGFTISEYDIISALTAAFIIGIVTFVMCVSGVEIGKKFGTKLSKGASVLGGIILILIGIEIFVTGIM